MKNLGEILKAGKSGFESVIKATIYLTVSHNKLKFQFDINF